MSDLDNSDVELDYKYPNKDDKEEKKEKEDKEIPKPITSKKLSEYKIDSEDDNSENDDDVDADDSKDDDDDADDDDDDDDMGNIDKVDIIDDDIKSDLNIDKDNDVGDVLLSKNTPVEFSEVEHKITDITYLSPINSDVESEDEDYLQKFDEEIRDKHLIKYHPELLTGNSIEVEMLTKIVRDSNNNIIDENHKTQPFLSKYEKTKILGQRTKQLNIGDKPYIDVPKSIIDGYLIAQLELKEKKIPVIIRRPLPGGKSEYWKLSDLELL